MPDELNRFSAVDAIALPLPCLDHIGLLFRNEEGEAMEVQMDIQSASLFHRRLQYTLHRTVREQTEELIAIAEEATEHADCLRD